MTYCALDLETSTKKTFKRLANPFDKDNYVVALGAKTEGQDGCVLNYYEDNKSFKTILQTYDEYHDYIYSPITRRFDLLIGFNFKFDLLYLWGGKYFQDWLSGGGKIWCCQLAEYMLRAQPQHSYISLNECAEQYGGTQKPDKIKEYWNQGVDTKDIPKDELLSYLEGDVLNTEIIYLAQRKKAEELGMLPIIESMMESLLATTEMEYNGMYIDQQAANKYKESLTKSSELLQEQNMKIIQEAYNLDNETINKLNLASNKHLSAILFGGTITLEHKQEDGVFKSGAKLGHIKYRNIKTDIKLSGMFKAKLGWKKAIGNAYSVDEAVLKQLINKSSKYSVLVQNLLYARKQSKELGTYVQPILYLVQPDGYIHHQLNHTITATGRLSSANPNLQNVPRSSKADGAGIKTLFTSRYKDGVIIDFDFKNIEVVAAAYLSKDKQMIKDIEEGVDTHIRNAAIVFNVPEEAVTEEQRQFAKIASFQLLYGAGINRLTAVTFAGDEDKAKLFVANYYKRYPTLKLWQEQLVKKVNVLAKDKGEINNSGNPIKEAIYQNVSGRILKFIERDAPKWLQEKGVLVGFNPPDIKDYPVQSFATADIALIMLSKLYRALLNHEDKAKLINTVHDSIVLDCRKEHLTFIVELSKLILEDVKSTLKEKLNIDFNVPLKVDVKVGPNWGQMTKYKHEVRDDDRKQYES